jgi:5-methyltetrahydropteroyltriglutamate--homocysteine methyltransferase
MKRSTDRILTTHTGKSPRPPDLFDMLQGAEAGRAPDPDAMQARTRSAVADVVQEQAAAGVDIVSDGEQAKAWLLRVRARSAEGTGRYRRRAAAVR